MFIERLKTEQRESAIKSGHTRRSLAEILSRPVALDTLNLDKREYADCGELNFYGLGIYRLSEKNSEID